MVVACFVALNIGLFIRFGLQSGSHDSSAPPGPLPSVAVKPLQNFGNDGNPVDLGAELTESLWRALTETQALKVSPISSLITYQGTQKATRKMGEELKVDAVVEGSVERAGEDVRIALQLVETATGKSLWAGHHTGELSQWLKLRDNTAQTAGANIRARLGISEMPRDGASR